MIFISYSSKDEEFANNIYDNCNKFNLKVFMAKHSINAGEIWSEKILNNLKKSEIVIYIASNNSLESKNVQNELGGALLTQKTIIPLLIDIEPEELPPWVAEYQAININDIDKLDYKMSQIVKKLKGNKTTIGLVIASITLAILAIVNYYTNKKRS